jgi:hypothetical protein
VNKRLAQLGRSSFSLCLLAIVLQSVLLAGCATNKSKRWLTTAAGVATGAGVGIMSAPEGERREQHALYWGAILGLGAALVAQEVFSDEDQIEKLKSENERLGLQLDMIQNANKVLLKEGKGYFKSPTGEEFFSSGKAKWSLFQIDLWVKYGPNRMVHHDKLIELLPLD